MKEKSLWPTDKKTCKTVAKISDFEYLTLELGLFGYSGSSLYYDMLERSSVSNIIACARRADLTATVVYSGIPICYDNCFPGRNNVAYKLDDNDDEVAVYKKAAFRFWEDICEIEFGCNPSSIDGFDEREAVNYYANLVGRMREKGYINDLLLRDHYVMCRYLDPVDYDAFPNPRSLLCRVPRKESDIFNLYYETYVAFDGETMSKLLKLLEDNLSPGQYSMARFEISTFKPYRRLLASSKCKSLNNVHDFTYRYELTDEEYMLLVLARRNSLVIRIV